MGNSSNDKAAKNLRGFADRLRDPLEHMRSELGKALEGVSCPDHAEIFVIGTNADGAPTVKSCCGNTAEALRKAFSQTAKP